MKSLSSCSYSTLHVQKGVLFSFESSAYSEESPDQQTLMALASIILVPFGLCGILHIKGGIGSSVPLRFAN